MMVPVPPRVRQRPVPPFPHSSARLGPMARRVNPAYLSDGPASFASPALARAGQPLAAGATPSRSSLRAVVHAEHSGHSTLTGRSIVGLETPAYVSTGLENVRMKVHQELHRLELATEGMPALDETRLELYRQSFEHFVGSFRAYQPILSTIKAEYDQAVTEVRNQVMHMQPQLTRYTALTSDYDLDLQMIYHKSDEETHSMRQRLDKLQRSTADTVRRVQITDAQLDEIGTEHSTAKAQLDEVEEAQHVLVTSLRQWERTLDELHTKASASDKSVWSIQRRKEETQQKMSTCKENTGRGEVTLKLKTEDLSGMVARIIELHAQIQEKTKEVREATSTTKEAHKKAKKMSRQFEDACEEAVDRSRVVTPPPDWSECADRVRSIVGDAWEEFEGTNNGVKELVKAICSLESEKISADEEFEIYTESVAMDGAAKAKLKEVDMDGAGEAGAETKWITCRGKGDAVPRYLRISGRVRNRYLTRAKVVQLISDFWAKSADKLISQGMDECLFNFMRDQFGTERMMYDMSYNLIFSVNSHAADPDCEMFGLILNGQLPTDAWFGQQEIIRSFRTKLEASDKLNHGGRMWKALSRKDFMHVISHEFPYKTEDDLRSLKRALAHDQPNADIYYRDLFLEDLNGGQTKFLETLRDQYISEVQQAYPRLEAAIRMVTLQDAVQNQRVTKIPEGQIYMVAKVLRDIELFNSLPDTELSELIQRMTIVTYKDGDTIINEGAQVNEDGMYIVREGLAEVIKEGIKGVLKTYGVGEYFGELALLHDDVRAATVMAKASRRGVCQCLKLNTEDFRRLASSEDNQAMLYVKQMEYFAMSKTVMSSAVTSAPAAETNQFMTTVKSIRTAITQHFDTAMPRVEIERLILIGLDISELAEQPAETPAPPRSSRGRAKTLSVEASEDTADQAVSKEKTYDDDAAVPLQGAVARWRRQLIPRFSKYPDPSEGRLARPGFSREVTKSEREAIESVFNEFDGDGTGTLDLEEVGELFRSVYGIEPSRKQLARLMVQIDTDGDGSVDLQEFIDAMSTVEEVRMAGEAFRVKQIFDKYDKDDSGELSIDELKELMREVWQDTNEKMLEELLKSVDSDGNGEVREPRHATSTGHLCITCHLLLVSSD